MTFLQKSALIYAHPRINAQKVSQKAKLQKDAASSL
jgi:hypothetical protein